MMSIITFSQEKSKKTIKEEYIEKTSNTKHKNRWFNTFNKKGEMISDGGWEFSKDSTVFVKKYTRKVLTVKERKLKYNYNKDKKVVTETEFFKKEDKVGQFTGFIKNYNCFIYDDNNRLNKTLYYEATIDTTDSGLEELNEDWEAYRRGIRKLNTNYIDYNLKLISSKKFNKKEQLERETDMLPLEGYDYFYDEDGNLESYSKFHIKYGKEIEIWNLRYFDIENEIFENYNLEGEYSVQYKFDEFGNWIEQTTLKNGYFHSKKTRHLVYY